MVDNNDKPRSTSNFIYNFIVRTLDFIPQFPLSTSCTMIPIKPALTPDIMPLPNIFKNFKVNEEIKDIEDKKYSNQMQNNSNNDYKEDFVSYLKSIFPNLVTGLSSSSNLATFIPAKINDHENNLEKVSDEKKQQQQHNIIDNKKNSDDEMSLALEKISKEMLNRFLNIFEKNQKMSKQREPQLPSKDSIQQSNLQMTPLREKKETLVEESNIINVNIQIGRIQIRTLSSRGSTYQGSHYSTSSYEQHSSSRPQKMSLQDYLKHRSNGRF